MEEEQLHPRKKEESKLKPTIDEEGEELLDINPMRKQWGYCKSEVVTYVEHETSPVFYLFLLFSMFVFGWMFIFLIPIAYFLMKNAVHRWSRWLNEIGTRHMFGIPDLSQNILVFQLGKCSIVISRTIGILVFTVLSVIFLYFSWFHDFGLQSTNTNALSGKSFTITNSWEEYIADWGSNVVISNNIRAKNVFVNKYENNVVTWKGYFIEKKETAGFSFIQNTFAYNILVKMEPSESEVEPDIVLSMTSSVYEQHKQTVDSLYNGDQISFTAKLIAMGDEFHVNHLHCLSITKTGARKYLPEIVVLESALPKDIPENADELPTGSA